MVTGYFPGGRAALRVARHQHSLSASRSIWLEWRTAMTRDASTCSQWTPTSRISTPHRLAKHQELDIEGETVQALGRGEVAGELPGKQLEAALGVAEAGQTEGAERQVEGAAHEVPVQRLPLGHQPPVDRPRTDGHRVGFGGLSRAGRDPRSAPTCRRR